MSEMLYLSTEDFEIRQGQKGQILCNKLEGLSLILFYSTDCQYCKPLLPKFRSLPNMISGCKFGIINLSKNTKLIHMSKQTIDPINYVPYIVLYVNGRPYLRYEGPHEERDIQKFIIDVGSSIQTKKQFHENISEFSVGKPLKGGPDRNRRCYLQFGDCYK